MRLKTEMLPWQPKPVDKLLPIKVGALYMEMGTGKTRTALEIIQRRLDAGKLTRVLWLCPCSVMRTIRDDLTKHAEGWGEIIRIHGIESLSGSIRLYEELRAYCAGEDVMLVVDESNLVKNHRAIRSARVTEIASLCKYRIILNGTPISRNEADLYSQWYILDWRILGYRSYWSFEANHLEYDEKIPGKIRRTLHVDYLVEKIAPYSYQVSRAECFQLLPKRRMDRYYDLDQKQKEHYEEVANDLLMRLDEMEPTTIYRLFSGLQMVISGLTVDSGGEHLTSKPAYEEPLDNPRMQCLLSVLKETGDEKTLIFAKYTHEIHAITEVLNRRQPGNAVPFYGEIPAKKRQEMLTRFAGDAQYMVCNKACAGYGLNLQFCRNVVFYSNDWDYATRIQAEDRVHRYGQEQEVRIYDILAWETLDIRIGRCLLRKENLVEDLKKDLRAANSVKELVHPWIYGKRKQKEAAAIGESLHEPDGV